MSYSKTIWNRPSTYLRAHTPRQPVLFFAPSELRRMALRFRAGFPGQVTYAVKANPEEVILQNLQGAGIDAFDVASLDEIALVGRATPGAAMHYNNPVRSRDEIARAVGSGVRSFSLDSAAELEKLCDLVPRDAELTVRFKLDVAGAAYDFGAKFGAGVPEATALLSAVAKAGYRASLTFHPGTQCTNPSAWASYIRAAALIAHRSQVRLERLNVGGGFPAFRTGKDAPDLEGIFDVIGAEVAQSFGAGRPKVLCEPGRGLVAECMSLATQVRAVRGGDVFLNDGVYGGFAEAPLIGSVDRIEVLGPDGLGRAGAMEQRTIFGPTCDSVDRLPEPVPLPRDLSEGDYVIFHGMGAYSTVTATRFNGFGTLEMATVTALQD